MCRTSLTDGLTGGLIVRFTIWTIVNDNPIALLPNRRNVRHLDLSRYCKLVGELFDFHVLLPLYANSTGTLRYRINAPIATRNQPK